MGFNSVQEAGSWEDKSKISGTKKGLLTNIKIGEGPVYEL